MKSTLKISVANPSPLCLTELCVEKLELVARDLALFTPFGLNANYIAKMSYMCDNYKSATTTSAVQHYTAEQVRKMGEEISSAVKRICEVGRKVWTNDPSRYEEYASIEDALPIAC